MKIALYIEDGREQIVLTPQSDTENALLAKLHEESTQLHVKRGSFYACRGGWTRQGLDDDSTILVLERRGD